MDKKQITDDFIKGYDCSQVVFRSFAEKFGISEDEANRIAAGFGGGMLLGAECGAFTGGLMALGLKYGHSNPEGLLDQKNVMIGKIMEFKERFVQEFESVQCKELIGYDVSKPEELQAALDSGKMIEFCPCLVEKVIKIVEEVL